MAAFLRSWRNSSGQLKLWSPFRTSNETLLSVMYTGQILCHSFNATEVMVGRGRGGRIPPGVPDGKELGPSRLKKYPGEGVYLVKWAERNLLVWNPLTVRLLESPLTPIFFFFCFCLGDKSFRASAPKTWNALPKGIRDQTNIITFKTMLKTHLFRMAYSNFL